MKYLLFLCTLIVFTNLYAQNPNLVLEKELISNGGGYMTKKHINLTLSWSLGEPITETLHQEDVNLILNQGFQQANENFEIVSIHTLNIPDNAIQVYPNPTYNGLLNLDLSLLKNYSATKAIVYSNNGKLLQSMAIKSSMESIDLSDYPFGTYLISIFSKTQLLKTIQIIKSK